MYKRQEPGQSQTPYCVGIFGKTKSAHLRSPFLGDEHVVAVQIAVLQPVLRQVRQPAGNILPKRDTGKRAIVRLGKTQNRATTVRTGERGERDEVRIERDCCWCSINSCSCCCSLLCCQTHAERRGQDRIHITLLGRCAYEAFATVSHSLIAILVF